MKKIILFFLLLSLKSGYAQHLIGNWNISSILSNTSVEEFILFPVQNHYKYGSKLTLNADGTFVSYQTPGCGLDKFPPSVSGKYTIIDENYINFFLEKMDEEQTVIINKDLGTYYYYKKDDGFVLSKSKGNLIQDKLVVNYRDLLSSKENEIKEYNNLLEWKPTLFTTEDAVVSNCLLANKIKNFEILYGQPVKYHRQKIYLIQVENTYRYVLYDLANNQVALFDDSKVSEINALVFKIDTDKKLKTKILKETLIPDRTTSENNTFTAFLKNRKIQKVVYNQYFVHDGGWFTTIYFDNERPVYVEFVQKVMYGSEERISKIGCYIVVGNENNKKVITRKIQMETGELFFPKAHFERALRDVNAQLKKQIQ